MLQILYTSRLCSSFRENDLQDVLTCARRNNPELGITGALAIHDHQAVQVIEGPEQSVIALFDLLKTDPRHDRVAVTLKRMVPIAQFHGWSMAHLSDPIRPEEFADPADLVAHIAARLSRTASDAVVTAPPIPQFAPTLVSTGPRST